MIIVNLNIEKILDDLKGSPDYANLAYFLKIIVIFFKTYYILLRFNYFF